MRRPYVVLTAVLLNGLLAAAPVAGQAVVPGEGWVVLPVEDYRALRTRALPVPPPPVPPPVDAVLTRIDYDLQIEAESVGGRAVITIDVLRDGWARVPIPSGLKVRDARLDGQPVSLVAGSPPHVLLSRSGRAVLTLEIVVPLTASAGVESIALPAASAPISRVALALPRSGVDLTVAGGFIAERAESTTESRWVVFGRPNLPLTFSWKRRVDDRRAGQPVRLRARVTEIVGLGEDLCQVTAGVHLEVVQGLARQIDLALPAGLMVNQITGATVGDWEATGGTLRVNLLEPVSSSASFVVHGEMRTARDGALAVPLVRVPSAERETGAVGVEVVGAGEITSRQARGLDPADPSELGDLLAGRESPSLMTLRLKPLTGVDARALTVTVVRYTPQAVLVANIEEARYRALVTEDGRLLVQARYAVRNNQRGFLKATLPAGSIVWSASVAGRPMRPGVGGDEAVLLPLEKGRAGQDVPTFVVDLVYLQRIESWTGKGRLRIDLPALDLPVSRTGLELYYSPRFQIEAEPGTFRVEADPGLFAEAFRAPLPPSPKPVHESVQKDEDRAAAALQALADRFRREFGGRTVIGSLPVHVAFPEFGPSIFLASELTAEARAPSVEIAFKRTNN